MRPRCIRFTLAGACLLASSGVLAQAGVTDTGPEYLENEPTRDPLGTGFRLLKLPFEEQRDNQLHVRSFYQNRVFDVLPDREDWALGGSLGAVGRYWDKRIALAVTGYTSQKLYGPDDKADTGALQRGHEGYSVLGEAYASLTLGDLAVQAGRYAVNLPYINKADIRMTPQTFQGGQFAYRASDKLTLGAGILTDIKPRNSDEFISMYERAGIDGDENVSLGGAVYQDGAGNLLGIYGLHAPDFLNGGYAEASKRFELGSGRFVQLSGQYTYQVSSGDELGGEFTVAQLGGRLTWRHEWISGSIAYTDYPRRDPLRSPWGSVAGYTSVMIKDFKRPEETAWLLGTTLDLAPWGVPWLKVNAKGVWGNTPDCGRTASPDQNEFDLNFTVSPPSGRLSGLVTQLRLARVQQDDSCRGGDADDISEVRVVLRYDLAF